MSCSSFQLWVVSDDREDRRRAEEHAAICDDCRRILVGQQVLRDQSATWIESYEAPLGLEQAIRIRVAEAARRPVVGNVVPNPPQSSKGRSRLWIALAASFLLGIGLGVFKLPAESGAPVETRRLLDTTSLEIARQEEVAQRRAISRLEEQVAPILAQASDQDLPIHLAARLMEYRTRLATLDGTIKDVQGFVEQNPGHPRARTMLLDAYKEKREVLREVIAREERSS
jgi:hypothetical protein